MKHLGVLALLAFICGQGAMAQDPRLRSMLSSAEVATLREKARDWFALRDVAESASGDREGFEQGLKQAKQDFVDSWQKKDPVAHVGDLLEIFDGVFLHAGKEGDGKVMAVESGDVGTYGRVVPAGYDAAQEHPAVLMIGDGAEPRDFKAVWGGVAFAAKSLFIMPGATGASGSERMRAAHSVLRQVGKDYSLDRDRLILDCGQGTTSFGLQMASSFPDLFAGLVVRVPEAVGDLPLGALAGLKILMVRRAATAEASDRLEMALVQIPGVCLTILEASDPSGHLALRKEIGQWAESVERQRFPATVVLTPNQGLGGQAYWVAAAGHIEGGARSLVAEADRQRNQIMVTGEGVSKVRILLNDALVDLDQEINLVVNGVRSRVRVERDLDAMLDRVFRRRDSGHLFSSELSVTVPPAGADEVNASVAGRLRGLIAAVDAEAALRAGQYLYSGFPKGVEESFADERAAYGLLLPAADQVMRRGEIGLGLWGFRVIGAAQQRHPLALANLALALRHAGMEGRAEETYREALRASPRDHTTWNDYGLLLKGLGHADRAREALEHSMSLQGDPPTGSAVTNLAVLEVMTERKLFPEAIAALSRLLARRPSAALARRTLLDLLTSSPDRMR